MSRGPHAYLTEDERSLRSAARREYSAALRQGRLVPEPCALCGDAVVHGHHEWGYDQPLRVRWLCAKHHGNEHLDEQQRRFRESYTRALVARTMGDAP